MNKRLLITVLISLFLAGGTFAAIKFSQGYRLNFKEGRVAGTGLLVVNSTPKGASVFINDKLTTATDTTLNLPPNDYKIKIVKDGYIAWEKNLKLQKELVTQTNAQLFPAVPDLKGLTAAGASNLTPSPDGQKMAFVVASASAKLKNGLWILEMTSSTLSFSREPRQVSQNTSIFDFNNAKLAWSPNSKQILAKNKSDSLLLDADRFNEPQNLKDVSATLTLTAKDWEEQLEIKKKRQWEKLPELMKKILKEDASHIYFSPDEEKVLYTATASAKIADNLKPSLPASNTQPQIRNLEPGKIYVYDLKEDKNFYLVDEALNNQNPSPEGKTNLKLTDSKKAELEISNRLTQIQNQYSPWQIQNLQWFPTSGHLILTENNKIVIMEYDGTNRSTVYAGPFTDSYVYPWPDGSKLLILTTLNPDSSLPSNLYAVELK